MDRRVELGSSFEEPTKPLPELGALRQQLPLKSRDRAEGQQAHHGPDLESLGLAVGKSEHVVEETIFLIPHARVLAEVGHRRRDPEEVLAELEGHVLVFGITDR